MRVVGWILLSVACLLAATLTCAAQGTAPSEAAGQKPLRTTIIPYERFNLTGPIMIKVRLNGSVSATFLFDTGASPSLLDSNLAQKLGLATHPAYTDDGKPFNPPWDAKHQADEVTLTSLELGTIPLVHVPLIAVNPRLLARMFGTQVDGIVGINILRFFAVALDARSRQIILQADGNVSDAQAGAIPVAGSAIIPLTATGSAFTVPALVNGKGKEELYIDTGAQTTAISAVTAKELKIKPTAKDVEEQTVYGALTYGHASVTDLRLGDFGLGGVDVDVPAKDDPRVPPHLGLDLLGRYFVVLDFPASKMYIRETSPRAGIGIDADPTPDHTLVVAGVRSGSPAALAGISAGDEIVEVGGKRIADLTTSQLAAEMVKPVGTEIVFKVRKKADGSLREVRVKVGLLP